MKYLKPFLGLAMMLLIAFPSIAQSKKDPKAQSILNGVSSKYKASKSISASFKIVSHDQKNKSTDQQTGSILLKGDKYKLTLRGQEIISDGKTVWTYIKEANEIQVNDVAERSDGISPTNIFTIYEKGFSTKYIGEAKENNIQVQQIELVPDDNNKPYFKILLSINKNEKVIASAKIFEKSGTHTTYSVEKLNMKSDVPDASFSLDASKYKGAEVIDLR